LRNRKALDFLVQHAQVREEEWREEEAAGGQPEEAAEGEQAAGAEGS
jgi:hypothetical protein